MKKYTYEEVKEYIEGFGYVLLSKEYKNSVSKLLIKCPKGHIYETSFSCFKSKESRCLECRNNEKSEKMKFSYEYVKEYIESFGYKLLSKEYINCRTKLLIECPKGHKYNVIFSSFKQGNRCPDCKRLLIDDVRQYIESFNYILLSKEYINNRTKLLLTCPIGHEFKMSFGSFKDKNQRCPICMNKLRIDKHRLSYEEVKEYIESFGYKLLSKEYINYTSKLLIECPNEHKYKARFNNFKQGSRCPICNISKGEQRIMNWLNKNNIKYVYNESYFKDLSTERGNPLRPDFIIEDYKIWIEYDGEVHYHIGYFNCTLLELMNRKYRDNIKNKYAKENGWKMIRIPYWEFDNIEEILEREIDK